jgi:mitochondrial splicing suppressor protein 51
MDMSLSYTCVRCVRAVHGSQIARHGAKLVGAASGTRKLSSRSKPAPSSRSILSRIENDAFREKSRNASTAAAPADQLEDNLERHFQYPEYGHYRPRTLLTQDNLFHPFSRSPIPEMRERARFTKQHAYCPHPAHHRTRVPTSPDDPESRKQVEGKTDALPPAHVSFECPDCGTATYCCEEHWADDYEAHMEICETLRQINEDDHDLRSGRYFAEFEYPGPQLEEILVNMTNWDTLLYTRQFEAINADRAMRQATRLLTYPFTLGSILHELSPYNIRRGGRLTTEGLKSLSGKLAQPPQFEKRTNSCSAALHLASASRWPRR